MTNLPYTDDDLRAEAARQYAEVLTAPDKTEVRDEMHTAPIPSRRHDETVRWGQLSANDFHAASSEVYELLDDAPDLSCWAIDLAASVLTHTTQLAWGHNTNWHLAVQLAHRRSVPADLHNELVTAIRHAVNGVLEARGIDTPELPQ